MKEITIDGVTYECTPKKEFTYPMMMELKTTGLIVEFVGLKKGTVLLTDNEKDTGWEINEYHEKFYSHTDNLWKPYNPVCDHKLDGYYVEESVEALCALKVLGYKLLSTVEVVGFQYLYIRDGKIGHCGDDYTDFNSKLKPMTFKDGKFITEPEKPKFKVGDYVVLPNKAIEQLHYIDGDNCYYDGVNVANYYKSSELKLWTIEEADPSDYVYCWGNHYHHRLLQKVKEAIKHEYENYAPDIESVAERLGLK